MATYQVEQMQEVWFRVEVEADSLSEAIELAQQKLADDEGFQNEESAVWTDDFWALNEDTGDDGMVEYNPTTTEWEMS